jgi:uncharacterized membrane protein required for colicin V production
LPIGLEKLAALFFVIAAGVLTSILILLLEKMMLKTKRVEETYKSVTHQHLEKILENSIKKLQEITRTKELHPSQVKKVLDELQYNLEQF